MQNKRVTHSALAGCIAIYLFWLAFQALWVLWDERPPVWDCGGHAFKVLSIADFWAARSWKETCGFLFTPAPVYPPLVHFVCAPFAWLGRHADTLILASDFIFGGILTLSLFQIGMLIGSPWVGSVAAGIMFFQPLTFALGHVFVLDIALAAMTALTYWRIITLERRWNERNAVWLGLAVSLGFFTKVAYPIYVLPGLVWLIWNAVYGNGGGRRIRSIILASLIPIFLCGWWYVIMFSEITATYHSIMDFHVKPGGAKMPYSGPLVFFWGYLVLYAQESIVPLVAFLAASIWLSWRNPALAHRFILWSLAGYILLCCIPNKDLRFFLPLVPSMAITTGLAIEQIKKPAVKIMLYCMLIVWCLLQAIIMTFPFLSQKFYLPFPLFGQTALLLHPPAVPSKDSSAVVSTFTFLAESSLEQQPANVLLLMDDEYHNIATLSYEAKRRHLELGLFPITEILSQSGSEFQDRLEKEYDFILYRNPPILSGFAHVNRNIQTLYQHLVVRSGLYDLVKWFPLQEGGRIEVYARHSS